MKQNKEINKISRKKFLEKCGSIIAGGSILGVSGVLIGKNIVHSSKPDIENPAGFRKDSFTSPYRLTSTFDVPDNIEAFELAGDKLIAATSDKVFVYDQKGSLLSNFAIGNNLRDIATDSDNIYLLFPASIEVYSHEGELLRNWEACSELSDYCSMTVSPDFVFVTDAANKNICKYTTKGNFVKIINSPNRFIIPSYTFGITYTDGMIYCSNSGKHSVEKYSLDGEYLGSFGQHGGGTGMFCGCCNPVHLAHTSTGEIITSEKGNPRISCYGSDGEFKNMLLDSRLLGGGYQAYDVKVQNDKLFVAGKNKISTFRYDRELASATSCSKCNVNCPIREGVTV